MNKYVGLQTSQFIEKLQWAEDGKTVRGNIPIPHGLASLWIQAKDMLKPSAFLGWLYKNQPLFRNRRDESIIFFKEYIFNISS